MYPRNNNQEKILELQKHPKQIRNISIVAHVDHGIFPECTNLIFSKGKTTISDALISSN
jgi:translation elongation factor EF-G